MTLLAPSGSLPTTSLPKDNDKMVGISSEVPTNEDHLDRLRYPSDIYTNETALNVDREHDVLSNLAGFSEGTPIIVTWFHSMESLADTQNTYSDLSFISNSVNTSFLRINGFEIRLSAPFEYSYNQQQTESTLTGEASIYPGFIPNMGDLFIYALQPGQLGIFKVNSAPRRLTIKKLSSHVVSFELIKLLDNDELDKLLERVRDTAWFDKQRFLNETAALITSDDVKDLDYMSQKFSELLYFFHSNFYDEYSLKSYVDADGVYDPYLVGFMKSFISTEELEGDYVEQLHPEAMLADHSFWRKLREPKLVNWSNYVGDMYVDIYVTDAVSYLVTSLINRQYVVLTRDISNPIHIYSKYISDNVGGIDTGLFTTFDSLIAFYMEYQVVDVDLLKELIEDIYNIEPAEQFYQIPVILYMIRMLERSIHTGQSIKLAVPDQLPYINIPFEQPSDAIVGELLTIISPDSKVIGMLDQNDDPIYPEVLDITYTVDGFTIDLTSIKAEHGIVGDLPGVWNVVVSNTAILLV